MANEKHLEILRHGVKAWNAWRKEMEEATGHLTADLSNTDFRGVDLNGANFREADLRKADLEEANLSGANLTGANLLDANLNCANLNEACLNTAILSNAGFYGAYLVGAKLLYSNLNSANFSSANLSYALLANTDCRETNFFIANLFGANLLGANLTRATLTNADFSEALLDSTTFADADISTVKGLETVRHLGPCSIGIDTLYLSKGKIPEVFLRGCGVPESFITQARALIGAEEGIQFYSCFISYSTQDEEFAQRLHGRLQQDQVRVWYSPHDIQGGRHMHEQIEDAIRTYDKLLILLSPDSMASSWVQTELRKARKMERRSGQRKLFPLRLVSHDVVKEWECPDGDSGEDLAAEVRKYFIPDFTRWKDHDAFEEAYKRLLKDLRTDQVAKV